MKEMSETGAYPFNAVNTWIQFGIGYSPKIVSDGPEFADQLGQFVQEDLRKGSLYGNAQ